MYGSIFYNCWAALIAFTVAFIVQIVEPFPLPVPSILSSLLWALAAFVLTFGIRLLLGYILYTPEEIEFDLGEEVASIDAYPNAKTSTVEISDESTEEVAKVVRTMLNKDEQPA